MVFNITNKVALITGGASGIGFEYAKELLRNGAKGVVLTDVNPEFGAQALQKINNLFGNDKAIFVETDVTNYEQFEDAFKKTINHFNHIDILINNAGMFNDAMWEREIAININGTVHGMRLGLDKYLPKYKTDNEALIVNISSVGGTQGFPFNPIYCGTKHAIIGMVRSWGVPEFYNETKTRVVGICPGATRTPMFMNTDGKRLGEMYDRYWKEFIPTEPTQEPEFVAKEVMEIIKFAPNGTIWVVENGEPSYEYVLQDRTTMKNNKLPYQ